MNDPATSRDEDWLLEVLACRDEEPEAGEDRWLAVVPEDRRGAVRERLRRLDEVAGSLGRRDESAPHIPGYRLEHEAGRGALGVVYAAQDETLQRRVALKVLRTPARRVLEEARRAAALRNPAIVTVHSVAEGEDATAIVMEWVDGRPLDEMARPLGWRQRTRLLAQVVPELL